MGIGQTLCAAILDLSRHGCDLTDPAVGEPVLEDDAYFHLSYLEDLCGTRLTLGEVLHAARGMRATRRGLGWPRPGDGDGAFRRRC